MENLIGIREHMTAERRRQVEALYHAAEDRKPRERNAFLAEACRGDEELRREVQSLLAKNAPEAVPNPIDEPTRTQLTAGAQLGPYRIDGILGAGGMGEVFKATDTRLSRAVAIKVLSSSQSPATGAVERFIQEARAASALNHP